jgi:uncharacterized tellurite resistance protein B-like protein
MSFDILDKVEEATTESDTFESHPGREFSIEEQFLYLNGLALVINADGHIDDTEKEYIRLLIKSVGMNESSLENMMNFAKSPDKDTEQAFFRTFRRRPIAQLFLFDALMVTHRDGKLHKKEIFVVNKMADQLEIDKDTQKDIHTLFCFIKNRQWQDSVIFFSSHLLNPDHFKHLLDYHDIDLDEFIEQTREIQTSEQMKEALEEKLGFDDLEWEPFAAVDDRMITKECVPQLISLFTHDITLPYLQAQIDREQMKIINGQLHLNDSDDERKPLALLHQLGMQYDQERHRLSSIDIDKRHFGFIVHLLCDIGVMDDDSYYPMGADTSWEEITEWSGDYRIDIARSDAEKCAHYSRSTITRHGGGTFLVLDDKCEDIRCLASKEDCIAAKIARADIVTGFDKPITEMVSFADLFRESIAAAGIQEDSSTRMDKIAYVLLSDKIRLIR